MPLYREQLDTMQCGNPDCDHSEHGPLYFHGRCHMQSPTWAHYQDGEVTIACAECSKPIATIAVAKRPAEAGLDASSSTDEPSESA